MSPGDWEVEVFSEPGKRTVASGEETVHPSNDQSILCDVFLKLRRLG
jgi:hypothetical protein